MNERPHIQYFDGLRIIAALGVVFMHTAADRLRAGVDAEWHVLNVLTSLAFTAVPLFFMMSGYLLMTSSKTTDLSVLFRHRLPRLVIPLAGWTVVAVLWNAFRSFDLTPGGVWTRLVSSLYSPAMSHLWYMYMLIVLYLISPILYGGIQALSKQKYGNVFLFVLVALVSLHTMLMAVLPEAAKPYINLNLFSRLKILDGHLATFLLGYLLGSCKKKIPNVLLALGAAATLAAIVVGTWVLTVRTGEFNQRFQYQASGYVVVLSAFVFLLFKQNYRTPSAAIKALSRPVVALSMPIYFMHNIFLSMLNYKGIKAQSLASLLLITLLAFAVSFIVTKTVATIKPICYIATGMTYKDACKSCNWVHTFKKLFRRGAAEEQ